MPQDVYVYGDSNTLSLFREDQTRLLCEPENWPEAVRRGHLLAWLAQADCSGTMRIFVDEPLDKEVERQWVARYSRRMDLDGRLVAVGHLDADGLCDVAENGYEEAADEDYVETYAFDTPSGLCRVEIYVLASWASVMFEGYPEVEAEEDDLINFAVRIVPDADAPKAPDDDPWIGFDQEPMRPFPAEPIGVGGQGVVIRPPDPPRVHGDWVATKGRGEVEELTAAFVGADGQAGAALGGWGSIELVWEGESRPALLFEDVTYSRQVTVADGRGAVHVMTDDHEFGSESCFRYTRWDAAGAVSESLWKGLSAIEANDLEVSHGLACGPDGAIYAALAGIDGGVHLAVRGADGWKSRRIATWSEADPAEEQDRRRLALTVAPDGTVHILYARPDLSLRHLRWRDGAVEEEPFGSKKEARELALAAGPDGIVHALTARRSWGKYRLVHRAFEEGRWSKAEVMKGDGHQSRCPSVGVDGEGRLHVCLLEHRGRVDDEEAERSAWYAVREPRAGWTRTRVVERCGFDVDLALDATGRPTVVFVSPAGGDLWFVRPRAR